MDKKSKILLIILIIITLASISFTFYKTVIKQDFEIIKTETEDSDTETPAEDIDLSQIE